MTMPLEPSWASNPDTMNWEITLPGSCLALQLAAERHGSAREVIEVIILFLKLL